VYSTRDSGRSWDLLPNVPSDGSVAALAAGSDGERVATYVGTSGERNTGAAGNVAVATTTDNALAGAGIYRLTTRLPSPQVYLPFVLGPSR